VREQRGGELFHAGPLVGDGSRWGEHGLPPGFDAFGMGERGEELGSFESGAFDLGLGEELGGVEDTAEVETAADCDEAAHLCGALLLLLDPGGVVRRCEHLHPRAAQRRLRANREMVAQLRPLQRFGAGFDEGVGNRRQQVHLSRIRPPRPAARSGRMEPGVV